MPVFILGIFVGVLMTLAALWLGMWIKDASGSDEEVASLAPSDIPDEDDGDAGGDSSASSVESPVSAETSL